MSDLEKFATNLRRVGDSRRQYFRPAYLKIGEHDRAAGHDEDFVMMRALRLIADGAHLLSVAEYIDVYLGQAPGRRRRTVAVCCRLHQRS